MNTLTTTTPLPSSAVCRLPSAVWLFLGALCYYAALPPLNISALALAVPICWGLVIRAQERGGASPPVRWYWVYLAAFLFWLASIWWIACPHPLTSIGLLALAAYLSIYWVIFFTATRIAVYRFRIPLLVAMPVCWIGTEYWRCNVVLGGFSFCSLEHAFYLHPPLIQFASIGGSLLVGGIIMLVGAATITCFSVRKRYFKIGSIVFFLIPTLLFFPFVGLVRSLDFSAIDADTSYSIVALQGDRQVRLNSTPEENNKTFRQYIDLTYQVADTKPDLIIFPETVCPIPVLQFEGTVKPVDLDLTDEEATDWERWLRQFVQEIDTPVIFGLSTCIFKDNPEKPLRLNSALLIQPQRGDELGKMYRYDKMHLVMFGEYIPFADYLPNDFFLRTLCPEASAGDKPVAFPIGQVDRRPLGGDAIAGQGSENKKIVFASVNICFESTVAPLIRRNVLELRKQGYDPRVLINISNDGWFRFSQQIEQHLATHVFRAVENGMWYVTATNGGFSAIISPTGTIVNIGKRGVAESVTGNIWWTDEVQTATLYQKYGDWYALFFGLVVFGLVIVSFSRYSGKKNTEPAA